jgi:hypothetical protein
MKPRRCYSVKLTIDKPVTLPAGGTHVYRQTATLGIIARDVEAAVAKAKELLAGTNASTTKCRSTGKRRNDRSRPSLSGF